MSNSEDPITAYDKSSFIKKFSQDLPGSDKHMEPTAEHTKVERWDENGEPYLEEYKGAGKLKGKVALLTGADSGIGRSAAMFFAREGADVTVQYLPEEQHDADVVKKTIEAEGRQCLLVALDLRDNANCEELVKRHVKQYGRIDILVNNASKQIMCKEIAELDLKHVADTFQTNILQMIAITKFAVPHMKRGGSIINTTSVTGYEGSPALLDYSSTKGAITSFTRSLAKQQAPNGIRVNCVAPGPVYTPLQPASRSAEEMEGWGIGKVPLHGRAAQPAELGATYVFLAGPDSNYITGTSIHVNAGQWIGA